MRKLALDDTILLKIEKPERYVGNEVNSVMKNPDETDIRFAFAFPDVYEIGMSHLGLQILYHMFNERPDVWCERVYSPWNDLDPVSYTHLDPARFSFWPTDLQTPVMWRRICSPRQNMMKWPPRS